MKLYLDANFFIYLFSPDSEFHGSCVKIADSIESGECDGITSVVTLVEVLKTESGRSLETAITRVQNVVFLPVDEKVSLQAAKLRREHKSLYAPDAIHLASAILSRVDNFVSNDAVLNKISKEYVSLKTITSSQFDN
jgi:predicted nucleic acid-binding protein